MAKTCKIISKIFLITVSAILALLLLFSVYIMFCKLVLKQTQPAIFGYSSAVVVSNSMVPTLNKGDLVVIRTQEGYAVDDIITFDDDIGLLTHRVVEITENGYITKGDVNDDNDPEIEASDVYGKVVLSIAGVGNFINFVKTPEGIIVIILSFLLIIGGYYTFSYFLAKGKDNKDVKKDKD